MEMHRLKIHEATPLWLDRRRSSALLLGLLPPELLWFGNVLELHLVLTLIIFIVLILLACMFAAGRLALEQHLVLELVGAGQHSEVGAVRRQQRQRVSEDLCADVCHHRLVWARAVHLNGQDDRIGRGCKGRFLNNLNRLSESDLGGESVAMEDDRLCLSIPTIQLDTATTARQNVAVHVHARQTLELVACEVGVVARVNVVVGQRMVHALVELELLVVEQRRRVEQTRKLSVVDGEFLPWFGGIVCKLDHEGFDALGVEMFFLHLVHEELKVRNI
mmetsp:Transcript_43412/g.94276  ORF Transcript_43412/g.94276 Transcript_43412/m.94276 type:complete len:276 (-) Transcript_43412:40-867(-)